MINEDLKKYIETTIFPQYPSDKGHGLENHINSVIRHSLEFAQQVPDINYDMVYVIAAYHDLGRNIDDATHEKISAQMLLADQNLKQFFTDQELKIMAEAVEDHRASVQSEPRSIYGKIVTSADRTQSADDIVIRATEFGLSLHPELDFDDNIKHATERLLKKFGKNGYALNKMYFNQENYKKVCEEIAELASDTDKFKQRYFALKGNNKTLSSHKTKNNL